MEQLFGSIPMVLNALGPNESVAEALVFAAWHRTAGELLAKRTAAVEFLENRLVVAVEDNTWKRHLEELAPQMLARLNGKLGHGTVKMIEFRIDAMAIESRKALETKPVDCAHVPDSITDAAEHIADEALRERFLDAASISLANKDTDR